MVKDVLRCATTARLDKELAALVKDRRLCCILRTVMLQARLATDGRHKVEILDHRPRQRSLYLPIGLPQAASARLQNEVFPMLAPVRVVETPQTRLFRLPKDAGAGCGARLRAEVFSEPVDLPC